MTEEQLNRIAAWVEKKVGQTKAEILAETSRLFNCTWGKLIKAKVISSLLIIEFGQETPSDEDWEDERDAMAD